ncbi:TPA: CarD family transcriptional regulator [bacterium]|nr:CarD family transcriptional regulator [bacterium]
MFKTGAKVVYPLQGVGIIEKIEEHKILDKIHKYYVIRLAAGDMKIMVPIDLQDKVGLRKVVDKPELDKAIKILRSKSTDIFSDWKERYTTNLDRMKTGSICKIAEVAKNLWTRNMEKPLSISEKRLFDSACTIIATELAYVQNIKLEEASSFVKNTLREVDTEEDK